MEVFPHNSKYYFWMVIPTKEVIYEVIENFKRGIWIFRYGELIVSFRHMNRKSCEFLWTTRITFKSDGITDDKCITLKWFTSWYLLFNYHRMYIPMFVIALPLVCMCTKVNCNSDFVFTLIFTFGTCIWIRTSELGSSGRKPLMEFKSENCINFEK